MTERFDPNNPQTELERRIFILIDDLKNGIHNRREFQEKITNTLYHAYNLETSFKKVFKEKNDLEMRYCIGLPSYKSISEFNPIEGSYIDKFIWEIKPYYYCWTVPIHQRSYNDQESWNITRRVTYKQFLKLMRQTFEENFPKKLPDKYFKNEKKY